MKSFTVTIPIAGHLVFEVEATDAAEARAKAFDMDSSKGELEWDTLETFGRGNVCYCPTPWNVEVEEND